MRLFVALDIDPEIRRRIAEFRDQMRPYAPDVRWVGPEPFTSLCSFSARPTKLRRIRRALRAGARHGDYHGVSRNRIFPEREGAARVLGWHRVRTSSLQQLADERRRRSASRSGSSGDSAPFKPHLTLARSGSGRPRPVRGEQSAAGLRVVGIKLGRAAADEFGSMTAREFCLYESKLSPSGAKYTKLNRYPWNRSALRR